MSADSKFRTRTAAVLAANVLCASAAVTAHAQQVCDIVFGAEGSFTAAFVAFDADSGSTGVWGTSGPVADCTPVDSFRNNAVGISTSDPAVINISMTNASQFVSGGYDIVSCKLNASSTPTPAGFTNTVTLALSNVGQPIVPPPTVVVRSISCGSGATTTTVSATTTTLFGTTTTTLTGRPDECDVTFRINEAVTIGVFTADIDYAAAGGEIGRVQGNLEGDCTINPAIPVAPGNFGTLNGVMQKLLRVDFTAEPPGLQGPIEFMTCKYFRDPGRAPAPGDFVTTFTAVVDGNFQFINPPPTMTVSELECAGGTGTTTTTLPGGLCVCGDPVAPDPGAFVATRAINATDALFTLNASVGAEQCALCACDINGSGTVNATDALQVLQAAVGQPIPLNCPPQGS